MKAHNALIVLILSIFLVTYPTSLQVAALEERSQALNATSNVSVSAAGSVFGDFNGDSYDDLAVGVVGEDVGAASGAGAVNVLYGGASGLQTSSPADQFWYQGNAGVNDTAEASDSFGAAVG